MNDLLTKTKAVRELLSCESRWTKSANARDRSLTPTSPYSGDAACWCIQGACLRVGGTLEYHILMENLREANRLDSMVGFNDSCHTTHADILNAVDKTIAYLENNQ